MKILVTGGTGTLGRPTVSRLLADGHAVRVMSRRQHQSSEPSLEFVRGDLATGTGLGEAVAGMEAVVHAGSPTRQPWQYQRGDVEGTQALLRESRGAGIAHFLYISIVGMEGVPYPYYKYKLRAEELVRRSGLAWSILRATQFYDLIDMLFRATSRPPLMIVPKGWRSQPVDAQDVARRIAEVVVEPPAELLPGFGGPEVLTLTEMAPAWLKAAGKRRRIVPVPIPGRMSAAFSAGRLLVPEHRDGKVGWEQWLQRTYGAAPPV
jgi:uncharacterized protein YbjT (DUF2867 family)